MPLLQELKADSEARESRKKARASGNTDSGPSGRQHDGRTSMFDIAPLADSYAGVKGSFADSDDNQTTNLCEGSTASHHPSTARSPCLVRAIFLVAKALATAGPTDVGNLSPATNEDYLARTFGIHGAIGSVKIMWPRTVKSNMCFLSG